MPEPPEAAVLAAPAAAPVAASAAASAPASASWLDDVSHAALELIAEALVELAGFGVAAISVARDDGLLHTAVVCGSDEARAELADQTLEADALRAELALGESWGLFTFVPHERLRGYVPLGWVGDYEMLDGEDAWHPEDLLVALFHDTGGRLRACLSIDVPDDGRRPGPERRALLERFAAQAERAVVSALERARLADRLRRADTARDIIRRAGRDLDVSMVLERAGDALLASTGSTGLFLRAFTGEGTSMVASRSLVEPLPDRPPTAAVAERIACDLWRRRQAGVLYPDDVVHLPADDDDIRALQRYLRQADTGSFLVVPLGVAEECVGVLTFVRPAGAPRWTPAETTYTFDLGADLGQLLFHARAYRREQRLARELRAVDDYKNRLITTVTQELSRPLTAIVGDLDALAREPLPPFARRAVDTMDRTSERLVRLVDDLMLLSRVADPDRELPRGSVDLGPVVREAGELSEAAARERDLTLRVRTPPFAPVVALGNVVELDRVVVNLVSNAVKYTHSGGTVTITLRPLEEERLVELVVADDGIGISAEDQAQLFTEFFRSTNPVALARPGTGLGLAIVDRIVRRHGGSIEVASELGAGTTVRVLLPAGAEP